MPIDYISQFDVLQIRTKLAAQLHESFDEWNLNGLQSAVAAPRMIVFGHELHPTLWDKAAVLLTRLIKNHPFHDGNKRIAFLAVREFLLRNGWELTVSVKDATTFTRGIVTGAVREADVGAWLEAHAQVRTNT